MAEEPEGGEIEAGGPEDEERGGSPTECGATIQEGDTAAPAGGDSPGAEVALPSLEPLREGYLDSQHYLNPVLGPRDTEAVPGVIEPPPGAQTDPRAEGVVSSCLEGPPSSKQGEFIPVREGIDLAEVLDNFAPRGTSRIYWGVQITGKAWLTGEGGVTIDPSMAYWTQNHDLAEKRAQSFGANLCRMEMTLIVPV